MFRLRYLHPFSHLDYTNESYRTLVNGSAAIEDYFRLHAAQQPGYLSLIRPFLWPGYAVGDFGCGGGALLDLVRGEGVDSTLAIEPFLGYHASLGARGHAVFPTARAALDAGRESTLDVALSVHVIEHTENPVEYLAEVRRLVKPGGLCIVLTPNLNDILLHVDPDRMAPFFYRRVHNYYFTADSLDWVGRLAGWEPVSRLFYHEFGLANTLLWLRDGRPAGHTRLPFVNEQADDFWRTYLVESGQANNVGAVLRNPTA